MYSLWVIISCVWPYFLPWVLGVQPWWERRVYVVENLRLIWSLSIIGTRIKFGSIIIFSSSLLLIFNKLTIFCQTNVTNKKGQPCLVDIFYVAGCHINVVKYGPAFRFQWSLLKLARHIKYSTFLYVSFSENTALHSLLNILEDAPSYRWPLSNLNLRYPSLVLKSCQF